MLVVSEDHLKKKEKNKNQLSVLQESKQGLDCLIIILEIYYYYFYSSAFFFVVNLPHSLIPLPSPETRASLPSRVGCRCAGTSQPVHRSRAEAAAPCRSTGTAAAAAAAPGGYRAPAAPAWLRVRASQEERRGEEEEERREEDVSRSAESLHGWSPSISGETTDINPPPPLPTQKWGAALGVMRSGTRQKS